MSPLWGKTDIEVSRPNWIDLTNYPAGTTLIFVDQEEAQTPSAKLKGLTGAGWYIYREYVNDNAETRYKTELVVPMSVSYTISGDNVADDTILTDYSLFITTQPVATTVVEGNAVSLTVVAASNPAGAVTYQWAKYDTVGQAWVDLVGEVTDTFTRAAVAIADEGDYQVVVTAADGTTTTTSDPATLTVTPL